MNHNLKRSLLAAALIAAPWAQALPPSELDRPPEIDPRPEAAQEIPAEPQEPTSTGVEMRASDVAPASPPAPVAVTVEREKAAAKRTEKLTKLDAKVADLANRIKKLADADRTSFELNLASVYAQRQAAFSRINSIRDAPGTLQQVEQAADDQLKAYEDSVEALKSQLGRGRPRA